MSRQNAIVSCGNDRKIEESRVLCGNIIQRHCLMSIRSVISVRLVFKKKLDPGFQIEIDNSLHVFIVPSFNTSGPNYLGNRIGLLTTCDNFLSTNGHTYM